MQSVTHPLDVVKKRYQVTGLRRPLTYGARVNPEVTATLGTCVRTIWAREGAAGFFKGLTPSLVKVCYLSVNAMLNMLLFVLLLASHRFMVHPWYGGTLTGISNWVHVQAAPASAVTFAAYELFLGALTALPASDR